ncbi:hypothetical protein [Moorella sp. E306M]|uniref:hypothetical protein n=1 Tax=Moorella sp. E306M TaxID=2572683 RepID=UPI00155A1A94|nr:hypothetical protein [Moorella sp. E306M]
MTCDQEREAIEVVAERDWRKLAELIHAKNERGFTEFVLRELYLQAMTFGM